MNRNITIRTNLLPGDLGYIAYMHGQLYAHEMGYGLNFEAYVLEGLSEFAKQYNPEKDGIWICEDAGKIVGFLMAFVRQDKVQLRYFILAPAYRGLGLGKKLMNLFIEFMMNNNYKKAYLWTTDEQLSAISLYMRYGFVLTEEFSSETFGKKLIERRYDLNLMVVEE
ncbi:MULTISPECIES: GNAT family N-acetyltransferase [Olivibacter]|uniref:GNAT family N-acetyltransferase n=1 Tax=Olivibacter oleidegradans TaxID=760123 RepID=A0ABV6HHW8_9SPHI|nr:MULTISPECIES: GNAT family N-acetyltransferase [Olivibacter]MDM8174534.1 GNAT family N-acetyltransferase [Olivibacter sp. 47]QEL01342.1 GNAT family N-acetyltransferase [Olivibacter sp. LS-1]